MSLDDADNQQTRQDITQQPGYKWTIKTLREFTNLLSRTITAWERFFNQETWCFCASDSQQLDLPSWSGYFTAMEKDIRELQDLRSSLQHQTDMLENLINSVGVLALISSIVAKFLAVGHTCCSCRKSNDTASK